MQRPLLATFVVLATLAGCATGLYDANDDGDLPEGGVGERDAQGPGNGSSGSSGSSGQNGSSGNPSSSSGQNASSSGEPSSSSGGSSSSSSGQTGSSSGGQASCGTVLINEVQAGGSGSGTTASAREFVELYNAGDCTVSLAGHTLVYRAATENTADNSAFVTFRSNDSIASGDYFWAAHASFGGSPDIQFTQTTTSGTLGGGGGKIALRDGSGNIVDSMGWGSATGSFVSGQSAPAPGNGSSVGRSPNGRDTGNDSSDFTVAGTPTPGQPN